MIIISNLIIFLGIASFTMLTSSYLVGMVSIFFLSILEIIQHGMSHFGFLIICELTIVVFIILEIKLRKDNSPFLRYNPMYNKNVLPQKIQFMICSIFLVAAALRMVTFFHPITRYERNMTKTEYQRMANAFINKIVIAHKKREDYHSVVKNNPFTNDVFVCKVASLLDSEYSRIDAINHSISMARQFNRESRKNEFARLSEECLRETSNVVQRIRLVGIGEFNATKMANDFSREYFSLYEKCGKAMLVDRENKIK